MEEAEEAYKGCLCFGRDSLLQFFFISFSPPQEQALANWH